MVSVGQIQAKFVWVTVTEKTGSLNTNSLKTVSCLLAAVSSSISNIATAKIALLARRTPRTLSPRLVGEDG